MAKKVTIDRHGRVTKHEEPGGAIGQDDWRRRLAGDPDPVMRDLATEPGVSRDLDVIDMEVIRDLLRAGKIRAFHKKRPDEPRLFFTKKKYTRSGQPYGRRRRFT